MNCQATITSSLRNKNPPATNGQPLTANSSVHGDPGAPGVVLWATAATRRSLPTLALIHPVFNYSLAKSHTRCTHHRHRPESPLNFRSEYR
jgi:hypothetical protein